MKTQTSNALSYCCNLLSFIFLDKEAEAINAIYLFGSAVRGELRKDSDIDLFFDCKKEDDPLVKRLTDACMVKFRGSKDFEKWKLFNFTYPFSIQIGTLNEWNLKLSIASEGFLLYSKKHILDVGERKVLFTITYPKKKKSYIKIRRLLFGRDEYYYKGKGLMHDLHGKQICSHTFMVPKTAQTKMMDLLTKEKIDFSMDEIVALGS